MVRRNLFILVQPVMATTILLRLVRVSRQGIVVTQLMTNYLQGIGHAKIFGQVREVQQHLIRKEEKVNIKIMNKEQVLGIIRHALTFVGGIFIIKGLSSEAVINETIGVVITAIGAIWSLIKNK